MTVVGTANVDEVVIGRHTILRTITIAVVVVNVLNIATIAVGPDRYDRWLLMALERNPSTWISAVLLAMTAVLAFAVGHGRSDVGRWRLVAGILVALSLDEVAVIHEKTGGIPGTPNITERAWVTVALLFVGWAAWRLLPWILQLEHRLRRGLLGGGAVFVTGAVLVEAIAGHRQAAQGSDTLFWILSTVEEDLELLGVVIVLVALLDHLRSTGRRLTLSFGPSAA